MCISPPFREKKKKKGHTDCFFLLRTERAQEADYLQGADQKIPNWLIKTTFLGKVEAIVRSGTTLRFGIIGFSKSDFILTLWFSL